jgi:hypothetical protein
MENVATEEFISRTEALKDFESCNAENPNWTPQRVKTLLLRQPAADVAPVVHGWWKKVRKSRSTWECSVCGTKVGAFFAGCSQYCYCCGAQMGGVTE